MNSLPEKYGKIKDLQPIEPIGACVTIGRKGPKGNPIDKDRFYFVLPFEESGVRGLHPSFDQYNNAKAEARKVLYGNIVHPLQEHFYRNYLKAQVLEKKHPHNFPACTGDGQNASRWDGGIEGNFKQIKCAHDKCNYRVKDAKGVVKCKPFLRFTFQVRWKTSAVPQVLIKFTSGSWHTSGAFKGFIDQINTAAQVMGIEDPIFFGFPFVMNLFNRTKAGKRFPMVTITPEVNPFTFFAKQKEEAGRLADLPSFAQLSDAPEEIAGDTKLLEGPELITSEQEAEIYEILKKDKDNIAKNVMLRRSGVDSVGLIPASEYGNTIIGLKAWIKA